MLPDCLEYERNLQNYHGKTLAAEDLNIIRVLLKDMMNNIVDQHKRHISESAEKYSEAIYEINEIVNQHIPKEFTVLLNIDGFERECQNMGTTNKNARYTADAEKCITGLKNSCKFFNKVVWTVVSATDYRMKHIAINAVKSSPNDFKPEEEFSNTKMATVLDSYMLDVENLRDVWNQSKVDQNSRPKYWYTSEDLADLFEEIPEVEKTKSSSDFIRSLIDFDVPNVNTYVDHFLKTQFDEGTDFQAVKLGQRGRNTTNDAANFAAVIICDLYFAYASRTQEIFNQLQLKLNTRFEKIFPPTRAGNLASNYLKAEIEDYTFNAEHCANQNTDAILYQLEEGHLFDTAVKLVYNTWMKKDHLNDEISTNLKFVILFDYILDYEAKKLN